MFESHQTPDYPPGVDPGDPLAPWNRTDPWEGRICAECRYCLPFVAKKWSAHDRDGYVCVSDDEAVEISSGDEACPCFRGYGDD